MAGLLRAPCRADTEVMDALRAVAGSAVFRFLYAAVAFAAGAYLVTRDDLVFPIVGGIVFATAMTVIERRRRRS